MIRVQTRTMKMYSPNCIHLYSKTIFTHQVYIYIIEMINNNLTFKLGKLKQCILSGNDRPGSRLVAFAYLHMEKVLESPVSQHNRQWAGNFFHENKDEKNFYCVFRRFDTILVRFIGFRTFHVDVYRKTKKIDKITSTDNVALRVR